MTPIENMDVDGIAVICTLLILTFIFIGIALGYTTGERENIKQVCQIIETNTKDYFECKELQEGEFYFEVRRKFELSGNPR